MNRLILAATLFEKGLKLWFSTYLSFSPFLISYALILWGLNGCGLKIFPHTSLEWDLSVIHYIVYILFFTLANIVAYQHYHRLKLTYKAMLQKLKKRYFQMFIVYFIGMFIIYNPLYLFSIVTVLQMGKVSVLPFLMALFCFCILIFNFVAPIMVLKKHSPWQSLKRSGKLIKGHWLTTFALIVYATTFIIMIEWGIEEFSNAFDDILSVVFFTLFPCLMVVQCDNLEKATK